MDYLFDHERLEVYKVARRFNRQVRVLLGEIPRGHGESKDNLERAAKSITRNTAEGAGKWKIADKVHYYHIARASATEAAASLDELVDFAIVDEDRIRASKETLSRVVSMLIAMIRAMGAREGEDMEGK